MGFNVFSTYAHDDFSGGFVFIYRELSRRRHNRSEIPTATTILAKAQQGNKSRSRRKKKEGNETKLQAPSTRDVDFVIPKF